MFRSTSRLLFVAIAAVSAACAARPGPAGATPDAGARRDRSVILADEMQSVQALNLYEVVQRLHPEWLKTRSTSTTGQRTGTVLNPDNDVQVYIDTQRAGSAEILKTMVVRSAASLRYYSAADAQVRFGSGNLNGVIQVVTR